MDIPQEQLPAIERNFHALIMERANQLTHKHKFDLPRLEAPFPSEQQKGWLPVPGMYGGFSYWFEKRSDTVTLISESWCRVVDGSGQRHEITAAGYRMVDEGFV